MTVYTFIMSVFAFGLALGVIVAVGFLLIVQLKGVWKNRTGIEDYIGLHLSFSFSSYWYLVPLEVQLTLTINRVSDFHSFFLPRPSSPTPSFSSQALKHLLVIIFSFSATLDEHFRSMENFVENVSQIGVVKRKSA